MKSIRILAALALSLPAFAQQQVWGQCEYRSNCFETIKLTHHRRWYRLDWPHDMSFRINLHGPQPLVFAVYPGSRSFPFNDHQSGNNPPLIYHHVFWCYTHKQPESSGLPNPPGQPVSRVQLLPPRPFHIL